MSREALLVSACLLGFECKYKGGSNKLDAASILQLREKYRLIPVCPEVAGGLPVPRQPSERQGSRLLNKAGEDVTAQYEAGAETALYLAKRYTCKKVLLKEKSPSCGRDLIYDGSFSGILTEGDGVTAEKLRAVGIEVYGESEISMLI